MSKALETGTRLVTLFNEGKGMECLDELYGDNVVSIEAEGSDELPARMEGIDAVRGKSQWWYENNEVHSAKATGPFVGGHDDKFSVVFDLDATPKGGERMQMREIGIYTVKDGKVVEEEFWPQRG